MARQLQTCALLIMLLAALNAGAFAADPIQKPLYRKQIVWDEGTNVCGNPCPVQDRDTGVIWLMLTWNDSSDSGKDLHADPSAYSCLRRSARRRYRLSL